MAVGVAPGSRGATCKEPRKASLSVFASEVAQEAKSQDGVQLPSSGDVSTTWGHWDRVEDGVLQGWTPCLRYKEAGAWIP